MVEKVLTVGAKIELRRYHGAAEKAPMYIRTYVSQLLDIKDKSRVSVAMPTEGGKLMLLEVGERYEVFFYTKQGLYYCIAKVEARYRSGQLVLAELAFQTALEKYQRRQFFRLNCILDMVYWTVDQPALIRDGVIIDISGGGARFNSRESYEPETRMKLQLKLPLTKIKPGEEIFAKVISCDLLPNKEKMYEVRVEFLEMTSAVQEAIVKFVFEEERKRRRRDNGG